MMTQKLYNSETVHSSVASHIGSGKLEYRYLRVFPVILLVPYHFHVVVEKKLTFYLHFFTPENYLFKIQYKILNLFKPIITYINQNKSDTIRVVYVHFEP